MTITALPGLGQGDVVGSIRIGRHTVAGVGEADRAAIDWLREPWPAGALSRSAFVGLAGDNLLTYEQFADGTEPTSSRAVEYRLYRSFSWYDDPPEAGVVVGVRFRTENAEVARQLVDVLVDRMPGAPAPTGAIAVAFHISADGTEVFNYATFTDAESHQYVVEHDLRADDEVPRIIADMSGVQPLGMTRYRLLGSRTRQRT